MSMIWGLQIGTIIPMILLTLGMSLEYGMVLVGISGSTMNLMNAN